MNTNDVLNKVQETMRGVFENPQINLNLQSSAKDISEWTSLNHINLIVALEHTFNIRFDLGEVEDLANIEELVHLIIEKSQ
ncbi:MAG: acyl carrier protein [Proteobacteria bacterium]|nr:acyl carrier protein [Pseudomonadota bacterium]